LCCFAHSVLSVFSPEYRKSNAFIPYLGVMEGI
jgi:hypothetical protein